MSFRENNLVDQTLIYHLVYHQTALAAGVPLIDPYLQGNSNFTHGVNFAVGGATALSIEALAEKNIIPFGTSSSLGIQLEWLSTHLASQCSTDIRGYSTTK